MIMPVEKDYCIFQRVSGGVNRYLQHIFNLFSVKIMLPKKLKTFKIFNNLIFIELFRL